ncbi:MAG: glycoside hydrolase family 27 protein [Solirubrobacteraceae bacterium]|jgi:alpha-galactosidase
MRRAGAAERLGRAPLRAAALACAAALLAVAGLAPGSSGATQSSTVLAATPYMGWDTYFTFGTHYDEATILAQASALQTSGLERDGYRLIWLDVGWWPGTRSSDGRITVSSKQWPHGMAWLTRTLHAEGFQVGLYTDAGKKGCGGIHEGSYGHYQQDVNTFAAWSFDAVKVDFCGGDALHLNPTTAYGKFHDAILHNSSHRPMLLDICVFPQPGQAGNGLPSFADSAFSSYDFGPSVGNSWRTDTDVGSPAGVPWSSVLRNLDADATEPSAAGPGHWNDPDYLGPDLGLTDAQFQTQFSMWAMLAAPLMVSGNIASISPASLATISNRQMIAIDQDPAGIQASLVSASGDGEVWMKPLLDGHVAIALLNRGELPLTISTSAQALSTAPGSQFPAAASYTLANVWTGTSSTTTGAISAAVAPDSTVVFVVSAAA